jgi:ABC-type transport system involved in multi-copper enzyme maturation permease subunit
MTLLKHPVYLAERKYQWSVMEKSRTGLVWILLALVMLLPALLTSLYLFFSTMLWGQAVNVVPSQTGIDPLPTLQMLMVVMNVALYFVIALVASALANSSVEREKQGNTWELLCLTGISARELVWGKWLASMRAIFGDYVILALLRIGWAVWFAAGFRVRLPADALPVSMAVGLLVLLALVFTVVDAAFNTALSIAVAVAEPSRRTGATGLGVRGLALLVTVWAWAQVIARLFDSPGATYVWHGIVFMAVYAAFTLVVVYLAQRLAIRAGYLAEGQSEKTVPVLS